MAGFFYVGIPFSIYTCWAKQCPTLFIQVLSLMSDNRRTQVITINQLQPGMFVVKLDIPWIDSPFLKHTRLIKSVTEVVKLRESGVKKVVIDLSKGRVSLSADAPEGKELTSEKGRGGSGEGSISPEKLSVIKSKSAVVEGVSQDATLALAAEMKLAVNIRTEIKNTVEILNANLESGKVVSADTLFPLIDQTLDSLERNNQALLNLVHLSRKSKKIVDHAFSVFCLTLNLALALKLSEEERGALAIAALLHDSGWLQLPLNLMGKRSRYVGTETKLVHSHLDIGLKMLSHSALPRLVVRIIREHHERCDGSGYPAGLSGDMMHSASKVLAVVDTYDECVHQLKDKPGMLPTNALRYLYREADSGKFDATVVAALINILGVYPVSSAVRLTTTEKAVIEQVFIETHLEPIVRIIYDKNEKPLREPYVADLRDPSNQHRKISELLLPGDLKDDPERRLVPVFE